MNLNSVARSVFELVLDLKILAADHSTADKFFVFARVSKFRKVEQLVSFLDEHPTVDRANHQHAISFATDAQRQDEVEQECLLHWGTNSKGKPNWPKHWSGKDSWERAVQAVVEFAEIYRSQFFLQSYHVHSGPAGIQHLSRDALICSFGIAHRLIQQLAATATEIIGDEFHLFDTNLELRDKLRRASAATGFYAVQMVLEQQSSVAGGSS